MEALNTRVERRAAQKLRQRELKKLARQMPGGALEAETLFKPWFHIFLWMEHLGLMIVIRALLPAPYSSLTLVVLWLLTSLPPIQWLPTRISFAFLRSLFEIPLDGESLLTRWCIAWFLCTQLHVVSVPWYVSLVVLHQSLCVPDLTGAMRRHMLLISAVVLSQCTSVAWIQQLATTALLINWLHVWFSGARINNPEKWTSESAAAWCLTSIVPMLLLMCPLVIAGHSWTARWIASLMWQYVHLTHAELIYSARWRTGPIATNVARTCVAPLAVCLVWAFLCTSWFWCTASYLAFLYVCMNEILYVPVIQLVWPAVERASMLALHSEDQFVARHPNLKRVFPLLRSLMQSTREEVTLHSAAGNVHE